MIFAFYLIAIFILFFLYKLRRYNLNKINIPTKDVYRENNTKQHLKKHNLLKKIPREHYFVILYIVYGRP